MNFLLFRKVFRSINSSTIFTCMTLTYDLETQDHVMAYVTFVISACTCPKAMNFYLFFRISGQEIHSNYCHFRDHNELPDPTT